MTDYEALERLKEKINGDMGAVDILINNAGLMPQNSFRDGEPKSVSRVMDVNVLSHFWVNYFVAVLTSFIFVVFLILFINFTKYKCL